MCRCREILTLVTVMICAVGLSCPVSGQTQDDFADAAAKMAPTIRDHIVAKQGNQNFRVAVFPFGDSEGRITLEMHEPNKILQGELIVSLTKLAQGTFLVLDKAGLANEFKSAGIDPAGVSSSDPQNTADVLQQIGVDAAVIGSIDAKGHFQVIGLNKINITATLVFKDGTFKQITGEADPTDIPPPDTTPKGRFKVEIIAVSPSGDEEEIPLITSKNPDSEFHKVFFAEIPPEFVVAVPTGASVNSNQPRFKIKIANFGSPAVIFSNDNDKQRLYGVVVTVDGINSFYQDQGDGSVGPVIRHPKNCKKWILSGPGQKVQPNSSQPGGFQLVNVPGNGHSVVEVPGFQKNNEFADSFVFVPSKESLAQSIGITNDIGIITVHFYPEDLPGDQQQVAPVHSAWPDLGIDIGPQVQNPVFAISPKLKANPVEVWRIFYRKKGDCPIPDDDRIPITEDILTAGTGDPLT